MINLKGVSLSFGPISIFDNVTCDIPKGSLVAVFGPNGIGKTTFLKIIVGIIKADKGIIKHDSNNIGFLVQRGLLDFSFPLSAIDVIGMGLYRENTWYKKASDSQTKRILKAVRKIGLGNIQNQLMSTLSGGQMQRVLFARLIVQDPDIILLDEPFNAIDCESLKYLLDQIKLWQKEGKTQVVVLHDLEIIKRYFKDCIIIGPGFFEKCSVDIIKKDPYAFTKKLFCGLHSGKHDII